MERDVIFFVITARAENFNSHAHVERDQPIVFLAPVLHNFNSHAHVERDGDFYYLKNIDSISTHTLTWSVTVRIYSQERPR